MRHQINRHTVIQFLFKRFAYYCIIIMYVSTHRTDTLYCKCTHQREMSLRFLQSIGEFNLDNRMVPYDVVSMHNEIVARFSYVLDLDYSSR
jgi:hypothetical protein